MEILKDIISKSQLINRSVDINHANEKSSPAVHAFDFSKFNNNVNKVIKREVEFITSYR